MENTHTAAQSESALATPQVPAAALEILGYLAVIAASSLAFVTGSLSVNGAQFLTVLMLSSLVLLSWVHLGHGRHPVFLFLCTLSLFQGGRLIAAWFGGLSNPLAVGVMLASPFDISRNVAGTVLLCLCLSAICVYAPCRWSYREIPPPSTVSARRYLPFLYLVYFASLPFLIYKNYLYYSYIQSHGGYLVFFSAYSDLVANVPLVVRLAALLPLPVLLLIFIFETRRRLLWTVVLLYFGGSIVLLLTGTRMASFSLVLTLWYVARFKSPKPSRLWRLVSLAVVLAVVANLIASFREGEDVGSHSAVDLVNFVGSQGNSLGVTEVAVMHPEIFRPHILSYLVHELQIEFVQADVSNYFRGRQFGYDVSVFLNPSEFSQGVATAGSYLGEAYLWGGILGVVAISLLLGRGLRWLYERSGNIKWLVVVAFVLPQVLLLPRGFLLGWVSSLLRASLLLLALAACWSVYSYVTDGLRLPAHGQEVSP
jgi:oligosaccharide repeat unit polymerase